VADFREELDRLESEHGGEGQLPLLDEKHGPELLLKASSKAGRDPGGDK
jgi:hypothetical protein